MFCLRQTWRWARFKRKRLDYLVQDVCEVHGQPSSKGPLNCPGTLRNLKVGEQLRYHKHDWPNVHDLAVARADTSVAIHSRLTGSNTALSFTLSITRADRGSSGGLIRETAVTSTSLVRVPLTSHSQRQARVCTCFLARTAVRGRSLGNLLDSWVVLRTPIDGGSTVATLHLSQDRNCPLRYSRSHTDWRTRAIRYRATLEGALMEPIKTIITDHFSQETPERSATMERFYFTQELGVTRGNEQNFAHPSAPSTAAVREQRLVESGRCGVREGGPSRSWHLLDRAIYKHRPGAIGFEPIRRNSGSIA